MNELLHKCAGYIRHIIGTHPWNCGPRARYQYLTHSTCTQCTSCDHYYWFNTVVGLWHVAIQFRTPMTTHFSGRFLSLFIAV